MQLRVEMLIGFEVICHFQVSYTCLIAGKRNRLLVLLLLL